MAGVSSFLALLIFLVLVGCQPEPTPVNSQHDEVSAASYQVTIEGHQLSYSPARLPVESLLTLTLVPAQPIVSAVGQIEGISNYMGQIPITFRYDANHKNWQSQFMLGACTEPDMRWRLKLEFKTITGQIIHIEDQFTSSLY